MGFEEEDTARDAVAYAPRPPTNHSFRIFFAQLSDVRTSLERVYAALEGGVDIERAVAASGLEFAREQLTAQIELFRRFVRTMGDVLCGLPEFVQLSRDLFDFDKLRATRRAIEILRRS
jgi:hypothetical protein